MRTYDIGVVGAGKIASSTHLPVLANAERANLQYVADVDGDQVKSLARSYGIDAVVIDDPGSLPECDIALLATPVGVRSGYIEEFVRRGTPVFSEKPFAPDTATHDEFVDTVNTVSCNYLRLCFGATRKLREVVANDVFGSVQRVELSEGGIVGATGRSQDTYQTDSSLSGGGVLVERGSHMVSQLVYVLDQAQIDIDDASITSDEGYDVDVNATLTAATETREIPVDFNLSRIRALSNQLDVAFENATVSIPIDEPDGQLTVSQDGETICTVKPDERWAQTFAQSAYLRWRQFFSKLGPDSEYSETIATGREVTQLIEDLYNTAEVTDL